MTVTQLEYLVALHNQGNFVLAAEHCNVTQPALTTQIKNLEGELGVMLFDRRRKPMVITEAGRAVVDQAEKILVEIHRLRDVADSFQGNLKGSLRIGIIPTLAPYLLPLFLRQFQAKYPSIDLVFVEDLSSNILQKLKQGHLDACLLATPVQVKETIAFPLFYERFYYYLNGESPLLERESLSPVDLKGKEPWVLKEGHCFRNQVVAICELEQHRIHPPALWYEGSSLDTLMRLVEVQQGWTMLPELAVQNLPSAKLHQVKQLTTDNLVREISLVVPTSHLKKPLFDQFREEIVTYLPQHMVALNGHKVVNTYIRA